MLFLKGHLEFPNVFAAGEKLWGHPGGEADCRAKVKVFNTGHFLQTSHFDEFDMGGIEIEKYRLVVSVFWDVTVG